MLGESRLAEDVVARRDYFTKPELRRQLGRLPAAQRARFDAYADGVNAWLARVAADPALRPRELALLNLSPAPWTVLDSAAIGVQLARTVPQRRRPRAAELARAADARRASASPRCCRCASAARRSRCRASEGRFPSQPGRSRSDEKRGFAKSRAFLGRPQAARRPVGRAAARAGRLPARGGSSHWAMRGPGNQAFLFTGPQLGFSIPELFVELEVHAPGLDVRGVTAPGVPVIAAGHNGRIAWGITSGLDDDDDLYVERLAGRSATASRAARARCTAVRDASAVSAGAKRQAPLLPHGPRPGAAAPGRRTAYARRYAIWKRELGRCAASPTQHAASVADGRARRVARLSWNENTLVADDAGHIGWWHPGRLPLRPKRWDERLPLPGPARPSGAACCRSRRSRKVIDPPQGCIANWNNTPSAGWTNGDAAAPEANVGALNRGGYLERLVRPPRRRRATRR